MYASILNFLQGSCANRRSHNASLLAYEKLTSGVELQPVTFVLKSGKKQKVRRKQFERDEHFHYPSSRTNCTPTYHQ